MAFGMLLIIWLGVCVAQELTPVPEIISNNGYAVESHKVTTEDGYILTLFRILPNKEKRKDKEPVIISHGLAGSSVDWLVQGPNKSLSYILSDEGYDVWLINHRGTRNSLGHTTYEAYGETSRNYWNFSITELGIYDTASTTDYVLQTTEQKKVYHFGMSQGGTVFYILNSMRPEYNAKFVAHFSYAPGVFICNMRNIFTKMSAYIENFRMYTELRHRIGDFNIALLCAGPLRHVCASIFVQFFGTMTESIRAHLKDWWDYYPDGFSSKQVIHFSQMLNTCKFETYADYGETPVPFDLSRVQVPVYAFAGEDDLVQDARDTAIIGSKLPGGFKKFFIIKKFRHLDFAISENARKLVYQPCLDIMNTL